MSRHLDEGLVFFGAVDFDVDLGVVLLLLVLSVERPPVADQVDRQQETQHAEDEEANVDLEEDASVSRASTW